MPTIEELQRDFLEDLHELELANADFFLLRQPVKPEDLFDKLCNHYQFEMFENNTYFKFILGSELPNYIRKRCAGSFGKYFPEGHFIGNIFRKER